MLIMNNDDKHYDVDANDSVEDNADYDTYGTVDTNDKRCC